MSFIIINPCKVKINKQESGEKSSRRASLYEINNMSFCDVVYDEYFSQEHA